MDRLAEVNGNLRMRALIHPSRHFFPPSPPSIYSLIYSLTAHRARETSPVIGAVSLAGAGELFKAAAGLVDA